MRQRFIRRGRAEQRSQVRVREPGRRVAREDRSIQRHGIGVVVTLVPRDGGEQREQCCAEPKHNRGMLRHPAIPGRDRTCGDQRHNRNRRQILEVIGDERVLERVHVEEAESREQDSSEQQHGGKRRTRSRPQEPAHRQQRQCSNGIHVVGRR